MTTEDLIIKFLKEGHTQPEIADLLKSNDIKPNSLRSIEGILKSIRNKYNCKTMFQLGWILSKNKILSDIAQLK